MSDEFRTPIKKIFEPLNEVTPFFWDAACTKDNCLVEHQKSYDVMYPFEGKSDYDYLKIDIEHVHKDVQDAVDIENDYTGSEYTCGDSVFCNPPYSRKLIGPFIKKAWEDSKHFRVVLLVKADMSTDWFNYSLKESTFYPVQINQQDMTIKDSYNQVIKRMGDYLTQSNIGILHLRNRVRFYVSEEEFERDRDCATSHWLKDGKIGHNKYEYPNDSLPAELVQTKHYKRVEDGIVSKAGANFPSMLLIMDRRSNG